MSNTYFVTIIFFIFMLLKIAIESYLDIRNRAYILANREKVPRRFEEKISLEEHQKAADYTICKSRIGQFFSLTDYCLLLYWTVGGGLQLVAGWALSFGLNELLTGLVFFIFFILISLIINLPQSIYTTFVIEERFGFNKMTPKIFIIDMVKGMLLGGIIGLPILYSVLWIMGAIGEYWWLYAWVFMTLVQLVLIWVYPNYIAPLFNKFSPLENSEMEASINSLLKGTGFISKGVFVMDASKRSSHGNAYFTGFGKSKRIVFFDTLLKSLTCQEVVAILAHELGHFKKRHIVKGLIKAIFLSLIGFFILGRLVEWKPFYSGHGISTMTNYMALIIFSMVSGIYTFFLTPLMAWTSRKYEFEADSFAAQFASAEDLISALVKLYKENASTLTPDPLYSSFYHSHPPASLRVNHLEHHCK